MAGVVIMLALVKVAKNPLLTCCCGVQPSTMLHSIMSD